MFKSFLVGVSILLLGFTSCKNKDNEQPEIKVIMPQEGTRYDDTEFINVEFIASDNELLSSGFIRLYTEDLTPISKVKNLRFSSNEEVVTHTFELEALEVNSGIHYIKIEVSDEAGNTKSEFIEIELIKSPSMGGSTLLFDSTSLNAYEVSRYNNFQTLSAIERNNFQGKITQVENDPKGQFCVYVAEEGNGSGLFFRDNRMTEFKLLAPFSAITGSRFIEDVYLDLSFDRGFFVAFNQGLSASRIKLYNSNGAELLEYNALPNRLVKQLANSEEYIFQYEVEINGGSRFLKAAFAASGAHAFEIALSAEVFNMHVDIEGTLWLLMNESSGLGLYSFNEQTLRLSKVMDIVENNLCHSAHDNAGNLILLSRGGKLLFVNTNNLSLSELTLPQGSYRTAQINYSRNLITATSANRVVLVDYAKRQIQTIVSHSKKQVHWLAMLND